MGCSEVDCEPPDSISLVMPPGSGNVSSEVRRDCPELAESCGADV